MKIAYVGQKLDGETAFIEKTNITWMPDGVHDVADAVAQEMLRYPGVFALADSGIGLADAVKSVGTTADDNPTAGLVTAPDGMVFEVLAMTKEELHAAAKKYGVEVHPKCGAPKVIAALVAAFPAKPE